MPTDALSYALQARRGKSMDPSMISLGRDSDSSAQISQNKPQDVRKGFEAGASVGSSGGNAGVGQKDSSHSGIDSRIGVDGASSSKGEAPGGKGSNNPSQYDWRSPQHGDQHTSPVGENQTPSPAHDWRSPDHKDEHTAPVREGQPMGTPASQSTGTGGGDLNSQIRGYVTGHASQNEYDQLKGMKPRSLGERAKMDALKNQYAGSDKNYGK